MRPVYVMSTASYAGKTGLCSSLVIRARERGLSVGYMKPLGTLPTRVDGVLVDEDCHGLCEALGLEGGAERLCPVMLTPQFIHSQLARPHASCALTVSEAFEAYAAGKDLVVLEGMSHLHEGRWLELSASRICKSLGSAALLLVKFRHELVLDDVLAAKDILGESLLGAVLNWVPEAKLPLINDSVIPFLADHGVETLGTVIRDDTLLRVTVGELAEELEGTVVCAAESADTYIDSFMVGAMGREKALSFFRLRPGKAVITGGDREDVQMAALSTETQGLILTGNMGPSDAVMERAKAAGVPVVVVDMDTLSAVARTEALVGRVRAHDSDRIERMHAKLTAVVDLDQILDRLK